MIRALDRGVGRVLDALRAHGLEENTLVFFTSDNGAPNYIGLPDVNRPFRGWKITFFEGGIHVPYFVKWPARLAAGQTFAAPVHGFDIFATAAAAAGAPLPSDRKIDGVDLLPFVRGERAGVPHRALFWRSGPLPGRAGRRLEAPGRRAAAGQRLALRPRTPIPPSRRTSPRASPSASPRCGARSRSTTRSRWRPPGRR